MPVKRINTPAVSNSGDQVLRLYEELERSIVAVRPKENLAPLRKAFDFAFRLHDDQTRVSGEPYMVHPVAVTQILANRQMDMVCLQTALLHDVVEDTGVSVDDIRAEFGEEVAKCVDGVTKLNRLEFYSREERQAESMRKMLLAMVSDIRVILVKLADRLHNMRTLSCLSPERRERISHETLDIYAPIANRLGMGRIRTELEDLAFGNLEPEAYRDIVSQVEKKRQGNEEFLDRVREVVEENLSRAGIHARLEGRAKRAYSIYRKVKTQRTSLEQVYDLLAVRIITESVKDCYAALGVIHHEWTPIPGRIKDFIAIPKPNRYQSLHTSVIGPGGTVFEVQIRTEEMHRIAEEGIAAHWKYKEGHKSSAPMSSRSRGSGN